MRVEMRTGRCEGQPLGARAALCMRRPVPAPGLEAMQAVQPVPGAPRPPWQVCVHLRACAWAPGAADRPPGGCEGEQVSREGERAAQDTGWGRAQGGVRQEPESGRRGRCRTFLVLGAARGGRRR